MRIALWTAQILLAAAFLFAGASKYMMPAEEMVKNMPVPVPIWFVRFIGTCEILGAFGMILPGLLRIKPGLTPLAAAGLVIIMIGAVSFTVYGMGVALAILPFILLLLAAFVAYGRWKVLPLQGR